MESTAGAVLAGGASSRMGRNKAGLVLPDGRTFLERALELMAGVTPVQLILGFDQILTDHKIGTHERLPDLHPGLGPLSGIETALASGTARGYLFMAVDQVRLKAEHLTPLLAGSLVRARAYQHGGALIPLPMYAPASALAAAKQILAGQTRSLRRFITHCNADLIDLPPEQLQYLASVNTPEDYQSLLKAQP